MSSLQLSPEVHQLVNDVLVWIGFGTLVGLVARGLMPGRDPAGAITTLLLGIAGSVLGCGCVGFFYETERLTPTSPMGMVVAVAVLSRYWVSTDCMETCFPGSPPTHGLTRRRNTDRTTPIAAVTARRITRTDPRGCENRRPTLAGRVGNSAFDGSSVSRWR